MYDGTVLKRDVTAKTNQMIMRPVPCQAGARQACLGVGGEGPEQNDRKHQVGRGKIVGMEATSLVPTFCILTGIPVDGSRVLGC